MRRLLLTALAAGISLILTPDPADACSCVAGFPPCQRLWLGGDDYPSIVFEATVEAVETDLAPAIDPSGQRYPVRKVRVRDIVKHLGDPQLVVTTAMTAEACGYEFQIGRRYLIHADLDPIDGSLSTTRCSMTGPIEQAAELLGYLRTLSKPSPGGRVSGTVRLSARPAMFGAPDDPPSALAGARVTINGPVARSVTTDDHGEFVLDEVPPGPYELTVATADRRELATPAPQAFVLPNPYACYTTVVDVAINGVVEGSVVDPGGNGVSGAVLNLRPAEHPDQHQVGYSLAISDELGRYVFDGLPAGRYIVGVNLSTGPQPSSPFAVTYAADGSGRPEVIDLPVGGLHQLRPIVVSKLERVTMSGRVVWPDGRGAAGYDVIASPAGEKSYSLAAGSARTDAAGRFALQVFEGLTYRIRALNGSPIMGDLTVPAGAEVVVVLRPHP